MHRVIHFEIRSPDPEAAGSFYSQVFGWTITKKQTQDYWLIHTGTQTERGINGGISKVEKKGKGIVPTVSVEDLKLHIQKVQENGGKVVKFPVTLSGTGYLAYCEDPEGNIFAILQYDSSAK